MKTNIIILSLLFLSLTGFSQANKAKAKGAKPQAVKQEQAKPKGPLSMSEFIYNDYKKMLQTDERLITTTQKTYVFPWDVLGKMKKDLMSASLDTVFKNLSFVKEGDQLQINSAFPVNVKIDEGLFDMNVLDYMLRNQKGEKVDLNTNMKMIGFGNKYLTYSATDSVGNFKTFNNNILTLSVRCPIATPATKVSGSLNIEGKLITGYQYKKITKQDIGKEISLTNQKFKILSINKGTAVIKILDGAGDFDYVITNAQNLPYNPTNKKKSLMTQMAYDLFKSQPNLTLQQFQAYDEQNREQLRGASAVKDIIIIKSSGEIANLYLYLPNEFVNKKQTVQVAL